MAKPLFTFFIRPDNKTPLQIRVEIYKTLKDLRTTPAPWSKTERASNDIYGVCFTSPKRKESSVVRLCKKYLGPGLIAHEMFHATSQFLARIKKCSHMDEEYACEIHENFVRFTHQEIFARGLRNEKPTGEVGD